MGEKRKKKQPQDFHLLAEKRGFKAEVSIEVLSHFQCSLCTQWWSIGDAPAKVFCYCPHCGELLKIMQKDKTDEGNNG